MRGATAASDAAYSGSRSLSDMLESQRVIRRMRDASLTEADADTKAARKPTASAKPEFVYAIRDKQVVALPAIKLTPKFVRFDAGAKTHNGQPMHAYAYREGFESTAGRGSTYGCPAALNSIGHAVYRTQEIAERALADRQRPWTRARATADEERVIRDAHRAMEARTRGKSGVHTTTEACRVIRDLLEVLAAITGIDSGAETLPFRQAAEGSM